MALPSSPGPSNSINVDLPLSTATGLREEAQLHPPIPSTSSTVSYDPTGSESETTNDDEGFTTVRRRRPKRHRNISDSDSTVITSKPLTVPPFTVIILPEPSVSVSTYNTVKLSRCLDSLVPGQITEIRLNRRKNVIAVDTASAAACDTLLQQTILCDTQVQVHVPRSMDSLSGVIRDVDSELSLEELASLLRADVEVLRVRRLGTSTTVCITFASKVMPTHVKVGYVRHPVRPYESRPLQCKKCHKLGHIAACCTSGARCVTCSGPHDSKDCISNVVKCINCGKPHDATSPLCPYLRREKEICKMRSHMPITYSEACSAVKTKRGRQPQKPNGPPQPLSQGTSVPVKEKPREKSTHSSDREKDNNPTAKQTTVRAMNTGTAVDSQSIAAPHSTREVPASSGHHSMEQAPAPNPTSGWTSWISWALTAITMGRTILASITGDWARKLEAFLQAIVRVLSLIAAPQSSIS